MVDVHENEKTPARVDGKLDLKETPAKVGNVNVNDQTPTNVDVNTNEKAPVRVDDNKVVLNETPVRVDQVNSNDTPTKLGDITGATVNNSLLDVSSNESLLSVIKLMKKPKFEIKEFSGNPLEYHKFVRHFKSMISDLCDNDDERMTYLERYTQGDAYKVVCGYSHLRSGYNTAMLELERRYGNDQHVANAYVKKVLNWPKIHIDDVKLLDEFSLFLTECLHAVADIEAISVLEYPENLKQIVKILPIQFHDKWRSLVQNKIDKGKLVKFKDLVEFVVQEAKKGCDINFGRHALKGESRSNNIPGARQKGSVGRSYAINAVSETNSSHDDTKGTYRLVCSLCKEAHHLSACSQFTAMSYEARVKHVRESKLCFGCLKRNHVKRDCRNVSTCAVCQAKHPTLLHSYNHSVSNSSQAPSTTSGVSSFGNDPMGVGNFAMAIVPLQVRMKNGAAVLAYAFLDPGSNVSFCTDSLLRKMGGSGKSLTLTIDTVGHPYTMHTRRVSGVQLMDLSGRHVIDLPDIYTKEQMPVNKGHIPTKDDIRKWPHLSDITFPEIDAHIELLIGINASDVYAPMDFRCGPSGSPHATLTRIGWIPWSVVRSSAHNLDNTATSNRIDLQHIEDQRLGELERLVKGFIESDFPERGVDDKKEHSAEDKTFLKVTGESIQKKENHYEVCLPFRSRYPVCPDNRVQVLNRLNNLKRRFSKDSKYKDEYVKFMNDLLSKGYAEPVPAQSLDLHDGHQWYIPHHGVMHPQKGKIRVVFDCAFQQQGFSLNKQLLPGPNLTNQLFGVLLRFRQDKVAIQGDIEGMFLQVRVPNLERDFLRFLWWPDGDVNSSPVDYRMCSHLFGASSSPSCANMALRAAAGEGIGIFSESVIETILRNFYVDDLLKSLPSDEIAISLIKEVTHLLSLGGFNIAKWCSNSRQVLDSVPLEARAKNLKRLDLSVETLPPERSLGLCWETNDDNFIFSSQLQGKSPTRRNILSVTSSIYDPIGLISPCVLPAKLVLRRLCGELWDKEVSGDILEMWVRWLGGLPALSVIKIPRCIKPTDFDIVTHQLHHFADASEVGYGTVSYLRTTSRNGHVHCALVFSKAKVAPLKKITIPRLELTAAKLAVELDVAIRRELDIEMDSVHFWTDSTSVLKYINNDSTRFHTFVANRVSYIREASSCDQWHHISGESNPADLASRGVTPEELQASNWFPGPDVLYQPENTWPYLSETDSYIDEKDQEVRKIACPAIVEDPDDLLVRFSSMAKLKAVVGWIFVFYKNVKRRVSLKKNQEKKLIDTETNHHRLDVDDLRAAESSLIKLEQGRHFSEDKRRLEEGLPISRSSPLRKLDPYLDQGILRVGGRLDKAEISNDMKHQALIPKTSRLAELIVRDAHRELGHLGRNAISAMVRQKYWVVGLNRVTRSVLSQCVVCKKYNARTLQQKMAELPENRLCWDKPAFTHVGMDYFGPFFVKSGRSDLKRYGVVFTCFSSRAVHIEMSTSLDTNSCINAIRRFVARRGSVESIRSDNGTNLVGARKELLEEFERLDPDLIQHTFAQKNIDWRFNPPGGSHFGGVWERIIRSIRKVLYGLMKEQTIRLSDEGLQTLFCEVEQILNSRPLTAESSEVHDLESLTPNHILLFKPHLPAPPGIFDPKDSYVRRKWRQVQYLSDQFWKRWVNEYLSTLQERQKWFLKGRNVAEGDVVLIVDGNVRNSWYLGRVIEVRPDKHGIVRVVRVKTATGVLERPITKLVLLLESDVPTD